MAESALAYIGARLRAARIAKGLRQSDVAKAAGISRPQVANIESGVAHASLSGFVAIVRYLSVDPSAVLQVPDCVRCGDDPPPGFSCNACGSGANDAG